MAFAAAAHRLPSTALVLPRASSAPPARSVRLAASATARAADRSGGQNAAAADARSGRREALAALSLVAAASAAAAALQLPAAAVAAEACELVDSPSGLQFCDTLVGSGVEAAAGMLIKAHYTGRLLDGSVFDSSYRRGRPLVFRVGVGEVIKGWDMGIIGTEGIPPMLAGGKRTLRIPAALAYGQRGAGCRGGVCAIPPNSVLEFDVEFVGKA